MKEVIEKIVSTENEAKSIIEGAKIEADRIISEAKRKAQDIIEKTKRDAIIEAQKIIDLAIEKAQQEKEKRLIEKAREIKSQFVLNEEARQKAIDWIVKTVCKMS
ncbi:MAG TPA: hypothetical protein PK800_01905 [Syntrophorhabdaceae bacterium]|nr:hypothetical protein [Syntrophorhabdaceae bacterium]